MGNAIYCASKRIITLNVLQGLVLLGLLIDQVFSQLASPQQDHSSLLHDHHPDLPFQFMVQLLVKGQFDRMGSFLFGLGVYRSWQQAELTRLDADQLFRRLLGGLLVIGLCLRLLLRSGELLVPFAGLGFTLLFVRNQSVSRLLRWMVGGTVLAIGVPTLLALAHPDELIWQSQGFSCYLSYELMMLFGLLVGKLDMSRGDLRLRVRLSRFQLGLLPAALLVKGAWVAVTLGLVALPQRVTAYQPLLVVLSGFLGPLLLTGVYLLDIGSSTRLMPTGWSRWMGRIGQMSLTNYVLQSVFYPLFVYGYGFVVGKPLSLVERAGIVVVIFCLQLCLSWVWLKRYRQGPLEWIGCHWVSRKLKKSNSVTAAKP